MCRAAQTSPSVPMVGVETAQPLVDPHVQLRGMGLTHISALLGHCHRPGEPPPLSAALWALRLQLQGSEIGGVERTAHGMGFGQSTREEKASRTEARLSLAAAR